MRQESRWRQDLADEAEANAANEPTLYSIDRNLGPADEPNQ
jgi:hypothetical protein